MSILNVRQMQTMDPMFKRDEVKFESLQRLNPNKSRDIKDIVNNVDHNKTPSITTYSKSSLSIIEEKDEIEYFKPVESGIKINDKISDITSCQFSPLKANDHKESVTCVTQHEESAELNSLKSNKLKFYNKLKEEAKKQDTNVQLMYEKLKNLQEAEIVSSIRIVYQSLEVYSEDKLVKPNRFTKSAHKKDCQEKDKVFCMNREYSAANKGIVEKQVKMAPSTHEYDLPPLHDILNHISSQAVLASPNAPIAPAIIILGECGEHIQDNDSSMSKYERLYLKDQNVKKACEMMSCFVLKEMKEHIKISALPLDKAIINVKRPGFLIEWKDWKICFIHLPNILKTKDLVDSYLNGLAGSTNDKYHIIAGDFNYSPKKIRDSNGNKLANCYPETVDAVTNAFTDLKLSKAQGTNSANTKVFDGFLTMANNIYRESEGYTDKDDEGMREQIIPLGLIPRVICDNTTHEGQTYTDHQGFAFDILVPYKTKEEKVKNDHLNKIAFYQQLIKSNSCVKDHLDPISDKSLSGSTIKLKNQLHNRSQDTKEFSTQPCPKVGNNINAYQVEEEYSTDDSNTLDLSDISQCSEALENNSELINLNDVLYMGDLFACLDLE